MANLPTTFLIRLHVQSDTVNDQIVHLHNQNPQLMIVTREQFQKIFKQVISVHVWLHLITL